LKVKPANTEQTLALELLRDDSIPLVTLFGAAGSGKTFLACAHVLHSIQKGNTSRVIIAKSMTPVGREIGFLPGGLEEKVNVWLGAFFDNFQKLGKSKYELEEDVRKGIIEISPITFIQGRSLSNTILVVDEVQNLDMDIIKQIVTRAGNGCKIILLGDPSQRFEGGLIDLTGFVEKCKMSPLVGHINFKKSVRSPLAQWAVETL
jgi:PhoH-like ATPase